VGGAAIRYAGPLPMPRARALPTAVVVSLLGWLPAQAGQSTASQSPLGGLTAIAAIISVVRRKSAIGGWLMFFLFQIFTGTVFSVFTLITVMAARNHTKLYAYYLLAMIPEVLAMVAVSVVCVALLRTWEWRWMAPLRGALALSIAVGIASVAIDVAKFPGSIALDAAPVISRSIILAYFLVSKRVESVFRAKDWEARQGAMTLGIRGASGD
jgi:hypothetical protein